MTVEPNKEALSTSRSNLPSSANAILRWSLPESLQEPLIGDCEEGFYNKRAQSKQKALFWLYKQIISILWNFGLTTQRGSIMFFMSMCGVIAIMLMALVLGGDYGMYVNIPSVIIVLIPSILAGAVYAEKGTFLSHFSLLINNNALKTLQQRQRYAKMFEIIGQTAMIMAWFGVVAGLVAISGNTTKDTFADVILPAFSVCILTLLYGLMLKALCHFAKIRILSGEGGVSSDNAATSINQKVLERGEA